MPYLVRQGRKAYWTGEADVSEERRQGAAASFTRRDVDTDGISMFAVTRESDEKLVVAAYACTKMEDGKLDLLRVEDEEVARFGAVTPVMGDTPVRTANGLHHALDWTADQLSDLVDYLLALRRASVRYAPRDVIAAVATLDPDDVAAGEHRDWVVKLKAKAR